MSLSEITQKVFRLVEEASGLPVHVEPDSNLPKNILAKLTMARGKMPFHQVTYRPDHWASPDYLIVYQCGFLLRHYAVPLSDRVDFASTDLAESTVGQWVRNNPKTPGLPQNGIDGLTSFLINRILSQLSLVPVGLRVDSWILKEYPELSALQREAATKQLEENATGLRPGVLGTLPDQALAARLAMSAAFSIYWAEKFGQPEISLPYRATGHLATGQALFDLWRGFPDDPASDQSLIHAWAAKLGLQGWYRWVHRPAS